MAIKMVRQSESVDSPISMITDKIIATETMLAVSKKAPITLDFLKRGISGLRSATNKKEGRNMPMVAATAPDTPPICQPIKVADENTGPGVNWPTAMASANCCCVSNPLLTNSASRKANKT